MAEILDACCGGRHWWWDKTHPLAVYMDERKVPLGNEWRATWECSPDVVGDFRSMPFADGSFRLVLFDPPHIIRKNATTKWSTRFYGALDPDTWQDDLRRGFSECWRVLAAGGSLVFKWSGDVSRCTPYFPADPIVGTRWKSGEDKAASWFIFYKPTDLGGISAERWEAETDSEREQRIRERADEARPNVSLTPGQAETLAKASAAATTHDGAA